MSGSLYPDDFPEEPVAGITEDEVEDFLAGIGKGDAATMLRQKVFEAIGEASTCWSNLDGAGIFDAAAASSIAERLCADLGLPVSADLLDGDR